MSKRELAYNMIDQLTNDVDELDKSMGMFHDAADVSKIPLEKEAWATAAAEKHLKSLENMKNEN